jgi:hypothetical protein
MRVAIRGLVLIYLIFMAVAFILEGLQIANQGDPARFAAWSRNMFGVVAIVLGSAVFALWRLSLGVTRARTLRAWLPTSLVIPARMSRYVSAQLVSLGAEGQLPSNSFALTTGGFGLTFWSGTRDPDAFLKIPWSDIREFETDTLQMGLWGNYPALSIVVRDSEPLAFCVTKPGLFGAGVLGQDELHTLVAELVAAQSQGPHD